MTAGTADSLANETPPAPEQGHIPRRNLSEAFEELYIDNSNAATGSKTPGVKQSSSENKTSDNNLISPTGVADLHHRPEEDDRDDGYEEENSATPYFYLHPDLKRDLSQAVINRVSIYGVIHDINKEANAMAANDDSPFGRAAANPEDVNEEHSPLVEAVKGKWALPEPVAEVIAPQAACIDEERWLLSAIEMRGDDENRLIQACPPTFLQAMGEREYENPLTSLSNGSRTQLWKPSRSWWEAKSGKNPWIEPKNHNKRWRYLWPLIHYHKFLAKCIKKLKRNGVDVKVSVSPVAAFLREEICAVSDHLASVSLFDSEEWRSCLEKFNGWTDTSPESEANLRGLISKLKLKPLAEHGDLDSPLLRNQIDEHFLKAMVQQRKQMETTSEQQDLRKANKPTTKVNRKHQADAMPSACPPTHSHQNPMSPYHVHNLGTGQPPRGSGVRRQRMAYPYHPQWWGHLHATQSQQYPTFADDTSLSSADGNYLPGDFGMYPLAPNGHFYHPHPAAFHPATGSGMEYPHPNGPGFDPNIPPESGICPMPYRPDHAGLGFYSHPPVDPSMAFAMQQQQDNIAMQYGVPPSPANRAPHSPSTRQNGVGQGELNSGAEQTHHKYDPSGTPRSPYWGHLDTTIAMGLSTPQTNTKQMRPCEDLAAAQEENEENAAAGTAQPLLLRQSQYYGYGPVNNYGPPSPATQFMMSPQANFAYNYGYGYSPNHVPLVMSSQQYSSPQPHGRSKRRSSSRKEVAPDASLAIQTNSTTPEREEWETERPTSSESERYLEEAQTR